MELLNENKVTLPDLPAKAGKKLVLAHEIAGRIVQMMNVNTPTDLSGAFLTIVHHGDQVKKASVYLTYGFDKNTVFRSGSKVVEAVFAAIENVSRIDYVSVDITAMASVGKFTI